MPNQSKRVNFRRNMAHDVVNTTTQKQATPSGAVHSLSGQNSFQKDETKQKEVEEKPFLMQPKLTVGAPDDPYEREADAVAERVMRMPDQNFIQRSCKNCEEENVQRKDAKEEDKILPTTLGDGQSYIQRTCEECKKETELPLPVPKIPFVQFKATKTQPEVSDSVQNTIENSRGGGNYMDDNTQSFMGSRMGADFSQVKIHTDFSAFQSTREINARAFTVGRDIYFNEGQYQPDTLAGKSLLAHELTHVVQQGKSGQAPQSLLRKEQSAEENTSGSVCVQYPGTPDSEAKTSQKTAESSETVDSPPPPDSGSSGRNAVAPEKSTPTIPVEKSREGENAEPTKPDTSSANDPAFKSVIKDARKQAKKQKDHKEPEDKTAEANNAVNVDDAAAMTAGAAVLTVNSNVNEKNENTTTFNATKFKTDLRKKITDQVPNVEKDAREFIKDDSKVNNIVAGTKTDIAHSQKEVVGSAQKISDLTAVSTEKQGEIFSGPNIGYTPETAGNKPFIKNPARAVPKPVEEDEVLMDKEHDADSLDKVMAENKMTDNQLAESQEEQFETTLTEKKNSQQQLCQIPDKLRQEETRQIDANSIDAKKMIGGNMADMYGKRDSNFGEVEKGQQNVKTEDEQRLQDYYDVIKVIYETTEANVKNRLAYLDCMVSCTFQDAIDSAFKTFKEHVTSRLDYYYDWHIVRRDYEKEDKMTRAYVNAPIDKRIKELTTEKANLDPANPRLVSIDHEIEKLKNSKAKLIIESIFEEEKKLFVDSLDVTIDAIAVMVENGLNDAKRIIADGTFAMDREYGNLDENNKLKAKEATDDFRLRFTDLEGKVNEKEKELSDNLVKQYTESVAKLKDTFETIRKEAALSFWERAWRKIKEVATIIFDIGKLLLNVLIKAASVIGDIIAHPIRFFGNLISAVSTGFKNFVKRLPEHLEAIIFKLVMGVVPPDIALPEQWDAKGIFSFVLDFFGLSKSNIRKQAVDKFGEPVVQKLEEAFELFVIFRNEGFAGLWEHIKEKIGNLKDAIIEEVKTFFKESIIKAAVEFLLSALTPASGFIKVCKSIISVVMFFIKNLTNILKLLDSILDSFVDIASGKIENAANKVENALADILLIGIKFLAALVGINLDKIQEKISKIINAVRTPINRALQWFFEKAEAFARKTGLLGVIEKGKEKYESGKEFVGEKVSAGKEKLKSAASGFISWIKARFSFRASDGSKHKLEVEESNENPVLWVHSDPRPVSEFLDFYEREFGEELSAAKKLNISEARAYIKNTINPYLKQISKAKKDGATEKAIDVMLGKLLDLEVGLSQLLKNLLGDTKNLKGIKEKYKLEGLAGTYASMPKPSGDELTADHQPQASILEWAAKQPFFQEKGVSNMKRRAEGRAQLGYAINLFHKRHVAGRTYGNDGKVTKKKFVDKIEDDLQSKKTFAQKREVVVKQLKLELRDDVKEMKSVAANEKSWIDITQNKKITEPDGKEMVKDIKKRIISGGDLLENQDIDSLKN